jgi:hypothetical protein
MVYALGVVLMFRPNESGLRRRWHFLDSIWVPLGALTGLGLLTLFWRAHGSF